jgi:uncharacterized protein
MKKLFRFVSQHSGILAIVAIASAAIPASFLADLHIDNSIEVWVPQKSKSYDEYREFVGRYGSDEFIVLGLEMPDAFADGALQRQSELSQKLRAVNGVEDVWDIPGLSRALWGDAPGWKDQAAKSAFLRNFVVGNTSRVAGMFLWLKPLHGPDARRALMQSIESVCAGFRSSEFKIHLAGSPRMNVALDLASARDSAVFLPVAIVVCILTLLLMLRSVKGVIGPMIAVSISAIWTVGLMAATGHTLNIVTVVMPTLHFVLGLSIGIRMVSHFNTHLTETKDVCIAIERTLNELFLPLLFMTITTMVGFLALLTSDLAPISELGLFSAIGLLFAFLSNLLIVPGIIAFRTAHFGSARYISLTHWSSVTGAYAARKPYRVIAVSTSLIVVCALLIPHIVTESNVLNFFPPDSEVQQDYEFVGRNLTGFYTLELEVQAAEEKGYALIEGLKRLEKDVSGLPGVARADHIGKIDSLRETLARTPPDSNEASPFTGLSDRFYYEGDGFVAMRFCVLVNTMRSSEFYPLLESIRELAQKRFPSGTIFRTTGIVALLNHSQSALVDTQVRSFATAFGIIIFMIGLLFRSPMAALASVLPNITPILLTFAWMSLRGIPLDAATVMIASVAIGIAVDNSIYFLSRFRDERRGGASVEAAVRATFNTIGRPMMFTSLVTAAGFAILTLAGFRPITYFGMLTAFTMLTAFAGTLFVAPACASALRLWSQKEEVCPILTATI